MLAQSRVPGLLAQVRTSLHRAQETGARYIFYTEPNKEQFFAESLDEFLTRAMARADGDHDFGMVLPARSEASFATFPSFQQYTESVANELLRIAIDGTEGRDYT